jgi:LPS sulfotransferase NodH
MNSNRMNLVKSKVRARGVEFYFYLRNLFPNPNPPRQKFVLFAHYRTGSTLLTSLLRSHPQIQCDHEIFLSFTKADLKRIFLPQLYINGRAKSCKFSIYGFNLKLYQLIKLQINPSTLLADLYSAGWKIIYLKRQNILHLSISQLTALQKKQWHMYSQVSAKPSKVYIEGDRLFDEIHFNEQILLQEEVVLRNLPHLAITYEDDLLDAANHQETLDKIFDYLDVASSPVQSEMVKIGARQLSDRIENYEEVSARIRQTKFVRFLDDSVSI